jgi:hypothetical protein
VITAWVFLTALLRVLPIYLEHRVIVSAMHNVAQGYDSAAHGREKVRQALQKTWAVNRIDGVESDSVAIDRRRTGVILTLSYSISFPLVGSIDGIWRFDDIVSDSRSARRSL